MIHEFAIEPELLTSFDRLRYYESHLGFDKGRVVAQFPSDWLFRIWKATPEVTGLTRSKTLEKLARLKRDALLDSKRRYDPSISWPQNAVRSQSQKTFRAIIAASNPENLSGITKDEDVDTASGSFAVEQQITIRRTAKIVAGLIAPMATIANRIILVDPYFSPAIGRNKTDRTRTYKTAWYHLLDELTHSLPGDVVLEYHTLRKSDRGLHPCVGVADAIDKARWLAECGEMRKHLPHVLTFRVVRWQERPGGDAFHARYALTERAGLLVEAGLDTKRDWFSRNMHVILMRSTLSQEQWIRFGLRKCPFDFVDEHVI